jgi:uncharacterized membrane protein (UPF0127 family)
MNNTRYSYFWWAAPIGAILIVAFAANLISNRAVSSTGEFLVNTTIIRAPHGTINAQIASTSADQELGLGSRSSLSTDSGMLFEFSDPGSYAFWMKDMHFHLDMVWIGADKAVVGVTSNIPPDSYPNLFLPPRTISYVLEINAGEAQKIAIATGTQLVF